MVTYYLLPFHRCNIATFRQGQLVKRVAGFVLGFLQLSCESVETFHADSKEGDQKYNKVGDMRRMNVTSKKIQFIIERASNPIICLMYGVKTHPTKTEGLLAAPENN